jgi:hypothetical protein
LVTETRVRVGAAVLSERGQVYAPHLAAGPFGGHDLDGAVFDGQAEHINTKR